MSRDCPEPRKGGGGGACFNCGEEGYDPRCPRFRESCSANIPHEGTRRPTALTLVCSRVLVASVMLRVTQLPSKKHHILINQMNV